MPTRGNPADVVRFRPAGGASIRYDNSFGEFETRLVLSELLGDTGRALPAARGQDGDRYAVIGTPSGDGLAWVTVWDTPLDAEEFAEAMGDGMARHYRAKVVSVGGHREIEASGRRVTIRTDKAGGRDVTIVEDLPAAVKGPILAPAAIQITAR